PVMLIGERGGIRNLGLAAEEPFATPHEARALRYELDTGGAWRPVGRYDVGFYDRKQEGKPFMRANCEGGIAFGPGYTNQWTADPSKPDQFVWITGHSLCSPEGPCNIPEEGGEPPQPGAGGPGGPGQPGTPGAPPAAQPAASVTPEGQSADDSEVHGVQGMAEGTFDEVAPPSALEEYPREGEASPPAGPSQAYLIDIDVNVDNNGQPIEAEFTRNDSTKIGDI